MLLYYAFICPSWQPFCPTHLTQCFSNNIAWFYCKLAFEELQMSLLTFYVHLRAIASFNFVENFFSRTMNLTLNCTVSWPKNSLFCQHTAQNKLLVNHICTHGTVQYSFTGTWSKFKHCFT